MLITFYPLLLWFVETRVKVQVEALTSLLRLFDVCSMCRKFLPIVNLRHIREQELWKSQEIPVISTAPAHGCTYSLLLRGKLLPPAGAAVRKSV